MSSIACAARVVALERAVCKRGERACTCERGRVLSTVCKKKCVLHVNKQQDVCANGEEQGGHSLASAIQSEHCVVCRTRGVHTSLLALMAQPPTRNPFDTPPR
jgi:hypothetical protein